MADISDYDKFDYDYSTYWNKREYENAAEKHILNNIFSSKRGRWFLDIGGSYGRLTSTYSPQYEKAIILDYSLKTLQRNRGNIQNKYPNSELIAANAYKMPFKDSTFDAALMVRVLHHIEKPDTYFKELSRIMENDSSYIQEYANKIHIKAALKSLFKLKFDIFNEEPYQQPKTNNLEGSQEDQESIFYNFHPKYMEKLLNKNGFSIQRKYGCSFLRSPLLKRIISTDLMILLEKIMQSTLSWSNISPSIVLETKLKKEDTKSKENNSLRDILACPSCKGDLTFENDSLAKCPKCKTNFEKKENIWDFRVK